MATQQELSALEAQRRNILRTIASVERVIQPLLNKVNNGITLSATEQQTLESNQRALEALNTSLANVRNQIIAVKTELGRYVPPETDNTPNASDTVDPNVDPFATGSDVTDDVPETVLRRDSITQQVGQDTINQSTLDPNAVRQFSQEQLSNLLNSTYQAINSIEALPTRERNTPANQQALATLQANYDVLVAESRRRANAGQEVGPVKRVPTPVAAETPEADIEIQVPEPDPAPQLNNAALERLKQQAAIKQSREPESPGDWRVKLRLASGSTYLYKFAEQTGNQQASGSSTGAGILSPLISTDGVVFPYTPRISTLYQAEYNNFHPTHSNYQYYWYKGSKVGEVQIDATFTAQDTKEAEYLLACIHFFKSASKMFYGQDAQRGSPPPLLFLTGLGNYQFNEHPCVISQFNYILPNDVDYIRAYSTQIDQNTSTLQYNLRNKNVNNGPSWAGTTTRRLINGLSFGAENKLPSLPANLNSDDATYVPTQIEINLVVLPVVTRLSASQQFSLQEYANGNALKTGFW